MFLRGLAKLILNAPVSAGPRAHPGSIAQVATGVKRNLRRLVIIRENYRKPRRGVANLRKFW